MAEHTKTLDQVVASNVRRLREHRDITKQALAQAMSVDRQVIADIEGARGRVRVVRWSELVTLCWIFDVPLWDLVLPEPSATIRVPTSRLPDGTVRRIVSHPVAGRLDTYDIDEPGFNRHELAALLFGLADETLAEEAMATYRRREQGKAAERVRSIIAEEVESAMLSIKERIEQEAWEKD